MARKNEYPRGTSVFKVIHSLVFGSKKGADES
jgi:hypothetical protein